MEKNKAKKNKTRSAKSLLTQKKKGKYWLFHILSLKKKNEKKEEGAREQMKMEEIVTLHIWTKQN